MPSFILVSCGAPLVVPNLNPVTEATRDAVRNEFWTEERAFSAEHEYALRVSNPPTFSRLQRVMSAFHSPRVSVDSEWVKVGPYSKTRVVQLVDAGLKHDDDVIQQWFNADDVLRLLEHAQSYQDMLLAVDAISGGHESRPTTREYVDNVLSQSQ